QEVKPTHGWEVTIGYRFQPSSRHFIGTNEQKQREINHNQIQNTYNLFDIALSYQLTPRVSINGSLPILVATRVQLYNPRGIYHTRGIADMTLGVRSWIFRPPTESGGNLAFGINLKFPTGKSDIKEAALDRNNRVVYATADQSILPGDGTWGFSIDSTAYKR